MLNVNAAEFFWLVGLLEGEGSFMKGPPSSPRSPRIKINMTDQDVMERVGRFFGLKVTFCKRAEKHHRDVYSLIITSARAIETMVALYPHMGKRRRQQIESALERHPGDRARLKPVVERPRLSPMLDFLL